ncbi:hypothetical protein LMG29739_05659 [Paraburkholderia solisilvae]|uniref:Uncharacterized protein n=1 Tax=Paraburkholderia solisilvae TaxID=624376 RepID=A0A6J5ETQ8_9BURK|nr:hypothetical protein LMG29739_05659 [Paraburkholderia solisilvae]
MHDRIDRLLRRPVLLATARVRLVPRLVPHLLAALLALVLALLLTLLLTRPPLRLTRLARLTRPPGLLATLRAPRMLTVRPLALTRLLRHALPAARPAAPLAGLVGLAMFCGFFRGLFGGFLLCLPRLLRELLLQLGQLFETHAQSCKNDA